MFPSVCRPYASQLRDVKRGRGHPPRPSIVNRLLSVLRRSGHGRTGKFEAAALSLCVGDRRDELHHPVPEAGETPPARSDSPGSGVPHPVAGRPTDRDLRSLETARPRVPRVTGPRRRRQRFCGTWRTATLSRPRCAGRAREPRWTPLRRAKGTRRREGYPPRCWPRSALQTRSSLPVSDGHSGSSPALPRVPAAARSSAGSGTPAHRPRPGRTLPLGGRQARGRSAADGDITKVRGVSTAGLDWTEASALTADGTERLREAAAVVTVLRGHAGVRACG